MTLIIKLMGEMRANPNTIGLVTPSALMNKMRKNLDLNNPKIKEVVERRIIDKMIIKANKKKDKKEIIMPMNFNVALQKYEPDLKKLKQIKNHYQLKLK